MHTIVDAAKEAGISAVIADVYKRQTFHIDYTYKTNVTMKNNIRCLTITDEEYPSRLRECEDAPVVLDVYKRQILSISV